MNFSAELIDLLKEKKGLSSDNKASEIIPGMNSGNMSKIRKGIENRHLNEEQALFIANECGLCADWVLVNLAEAVAKSDEAKEIWHSLAKKLNKSINAALLVLSLVFCGFGDENRQSTVFA